MNSNKRRVKKLIIIIAVISVLDWAVANIIPEKKNELKTRSSMLQKVITENGNTKRIDYVNEAGDISFAYDKQYATMISTKQDNTVLEEYFDAEGNPSKQSNGAYSVLREYDKQGREYKITYLGDNGLPTMTLFGYSYLLRAFDEKGRTKKELFYDINGEPTRTPYFAYGNVMDYDESGRNIRTTFIDQLGNPIKSGLGYAIIHRNYYEAGSNTGRIREEFYYDENEMPISLSLGEFGVHKEYDEYGRCYKVTYLDENGEPIVNSIGYTTVKRSFHEDDTIYTELFYDLNDKPVKLSEGQYGFIRRDGKISYSDKKGNVIFNLKNFLLHNHLFVPVFLMIILIISIKSNHTVNYVLLLLYCCFLVYMTLLFREGSTLNRKVSLFDSYNQMFSDKEYYYDVSNNILLFIPLSFILFQLYPDKKHLAIPAIASIMIELLQYATGRGVCAIDDLISNGLGAIIGFYIGKATEETRNEDYYLSQ